MTFTGYPAPISNYTYTPNQFFDVVLPHFSRGAVRLCAYMIRQALGWCDADGNPTDGRVAVSIETIALFANVSRRSVSAAIKELINGRVIECIREPSKSGQRNERSGLYALKWDKSATQYTSTPSDFNGFYDDGKSGCMTRVPDVYLDYTVLYETLSVAQVVGAILRNTVGYEIGRGYRRMQVRSSYSQIMEQTGIASRASISLALEEAVSGGHIIAVTPGSFNGGRDGYAAVYGIHWEDDWDGNTNTSKKCTRDSNPTLAKSVPETLAKTVPLNTSKKRTSIKDKITQEITQKKQQQQTSPTQSSSINSESDLDVSIVAALCAFGFERKVAEELALAHTADVIQAQLEYFKYRTKASNPQGMMRRAIEGNWAPPPAAKDKEQDKLRRKADLEAQRKATYIQENMSQYQTYVEDSLRHIRDTDPEAWYMFEEAEAKLIERLRNENPLYRAHPILLDTFLEHHNDEASVIERGREFFRTRIASIEDLFPIDPSKLLNKK